LNGSSISASGAGVSVVGSLATITTAGDYSLSGTLKDGQIVVNVKGKGLVRLFLNGVDITSSNSAPIDILDAEKVIVILGENSKNTLTDGKTYVFDDAVAKEPNAALFSKADLTIFGSGALDYDTTFKMTGGFLVAAGSSGMAMAPSPASSQSSVLVYLTSTQPAGSLVHIQNSAGEDLLTFAPAKAYQSIVLTSPALVKGATYTVFTGGSSQGTLKDGLYQGGSYTPGAQAASFTLSGAVTTVGSGGMGQGGGRH
jgi:hypothetical protein